ncbi:putative transcription factor C2H2 family [Dioscorea sansibarensis]
MSLGKPQLSFFQSLSSPPPPPPPLTNFQSNSIENKISPSILLITVILAVIFFISGLVHLLVRYLLRPINREPEEVDNVTVLQGQLQQLFHLHDAGVDQSYIDTLPIFLYKAIIGLKDPFDCAVCLCEFEADDKLRLLPKCSHAFHIECIDTWLLSHSTCPLCRSSLLPEFSPSCSSPMLFVLESASESSREPDSERADVGDDELRTSLSGDVHVNQKQAEIDAKDEVVTVKLGKFRNVETSGVAAIGEVEGEGCSVVETNRNLDQRRCFSMGSFEYVMDESSLLQVSIKLSKKKPAVIQKPGHRGAMSECDCHSRREGFSKGFDHSSRSFESIQGSAGGGGFGSSSSSSNLKKKESFSISKIWLRQKKKSSVVSGDFSTRAFSFRLSGGVTGDSKMKSSVSEADELEKSGSSEFGVDVEIGSSNSGAVLKAEEGPSFARRTLLWLGGRQNKVVNHV